MLVRRLGLEGRLKGEVLHTLSMNRVDDGYAPVRSHFGVVFHSVFRSSHALGHL